MKINFIGIGAQKCASTWIHSVLSDHPEVAVLPGKEIDFFSYYFNFGYEWYETQVGDVGAVKIIGEVSPSYFADSSDTPERVYSYNPEMRIVLSLRDPIERAYSNHLNEVKLGHVTSKNYEFEKGLTNNPMYLEQSRYGQQLARWLSVFPIEQILVVFQEDIRDDPFQQARNLYHFLGIDVSHKSWFLEKKVNESRIVKNTRIDSYLKILGNFGRSVGAGALVEVVRKNDFVCSVRHTHNQLDLRQVVPPMREETRAHLLNMLADDMHKLSHQLNRIDLPWPSWNAVCNRYVRD